MFDPDFGFVTYQQDEQDHDDDAMDDRKSA
jgi:hypothetical protein